MSSGSPGVGSGSGGVGSGAGGMVVAGSDVEVSVISGSACTAHNSGRSCGLLSGVIHVKASPCQGLIILHFSPTFSIPYSSFLPAHVIELRHFACRKCAVVDTYVVDRAVEKEICAISCANFKSMTR